MIARSEALRSRACIKVALKYGRRISSSFFVMYILPVKGDTFQTVLSIQKKKVWKKAHDRNRVRRRTESLYLRYFEIFTGYHCILFPDFKVLEASFDSLEKDFFSLVQQIKTCP